MSDSAAATQLASHPINETLRRITEASEDSRYAESRDVLGEDRKAALDRLFVFARRLKDLIANAADADVSFNGLNVISNALANAFNEVNAFYSNKNPSHVDNAASHLDSATSTAAWTFFQVPAKGSRAYAESVNAVQKAASDAIKKLQEQYSSLQPEIAQTQSQIAAQQQTIATATQEIAANKQASDSVVSEMRSSFAALESEIRTRTEAAEKERATSFDKLAKGLEGRASETLKRLAEHEAAAKRIVQIVGNVGVTGNYQNRAAEEGFQANFWRWITVTLFGVGVVLVTVTLAMHLANKVDLTTLITRFAIAVAISIPALYTARESARHRTNADRAKQTELELASLGPFLETLPTEQRQEIVGELAKSYFGRDVEPHQVHAPVSAEELQKTLAATADLVGKVKGVSS